MTSMKTIVGKIVSSRTISLSKAAKFLRTFVSVETEASHAVSAYLRRTSASFNELNLLHRQLRGTRTDRKQKKDRTHKLKREEHESSVPKKRIEGSEPAEKEGSVALEQTLESNATMDSARENSIGINENGSVKKKGNKKEKSNAGARSSNHSENQDGVVKLGENGGENKEIEISMKNKVKAGEKQVKSEENGDGSVGIEVIKKKKRKIIEAEGVGKNDASSQERHSLKKKRRRIEGSN